MSADPCMVTERRQNNIFLDGDMIYYFQLVFYFRKFIFYTRSLNVKNEKEAICDHYLVQQMRFPAI